MKLQPKSLFGIAAILSSALFVGTQAQAQLIYRSPLEDFGYVTSDQGYQPVYMASADQAAPQAQAPAPAAQTPSQAQTAALVQSGAAPRRGYEPLNNYFDAMEYETPNVAGAVYTGNTYTGVNYVEGLPFPSSVRNGLLPAENKMLGKIYFDGWVTGSVYDHNEWPVTKGFDENTKGLNSSISPYQMSQAYVTMGRQVEYSDHFSIGARVDALYGTDYQLASSLGLESENTTRSGAAAGNIYMADTHWNKNKRGGYPEYGLAIPQAYVEAYAPILSGLSAKVGHFYSPMGYESICSPNNFFHTHSYTMLYGQPQTVTGATAKLRLNNIFSVIGGAHQGWNVFDDNNDSWDIIGGFAFEGNPGDSLTFIVSSGDAILENRINPHTREFFTIDGRQTSYSLVLEKRLCPEVTWVLEHDLGVAEDGAYRYGRNHNKIRDDGHWYSVVNYLYFALAPNLDLGARAEWFCDENRTRLLTGEATSSEVPEMEYKWVGENVVDVSVGLNWRPSEFLTIRPEVRWDYSDIEKLDLNGDPLPKGKLYNSFEDDNRLTFGGDVIFHF
ncbi:MAG: outer membrane beta-barrel protein [Thermoguttaceae bacterium]|nr:outer membrane beta-barrel protein [Thermoguttaceae bacterium]